MVDQCTPEYTGQTRVCVIFLINKVNLFKMYEGERDRQREDVSNVIMNQVYSFLKGFTDPQTRTTASIYNYNIRLMY